MESKHLTIGALALSLGFAGLADKADARHENTDVVIACDDDHGGHGDTSLAGCNGECNGSCSSGGGDDD